jgi:ParB family transcriptional regulator, chromosome partitioning protein
MKLFDKQIPTTIVPSGSLQQLTVKELKTSFANPRVLFDREPLNELKESIRSYGVLVPITVYKMPGQERYSILDGERRYRCCKELEDEGIEIKIPANIVNPPNKISSVLYMFSIHTFRLGWEMMPTALSLKDLMEELKVRDNKKLSSLTGLSETQVERCKWLLSYPIRFQKMSLEKDPHKRIPSNFWIEAYPVIEIFDKEMPVFVQEKGREVIIQALVDKRNKGRIKSIIDFRKIRDAYSKSQEDKEDKKKFLEHLKDFISTEELEIDETFHSFITPRSIKTALNACTDFTEKLDRLKLEYATENREELINALGKVKSYVEKILTELKNVEPEKSEK